MNKDLIKENEKNNDNCHVHLYRIENTDLWMAYGFSAYSLRLCLKIYALDSLRGYSQELSGPYTLITNSVLSNLKKYVNVDEREDSHVYMTMNNPFDENEYVKWLDKCNVESKSQENGAQNDAKQVDSLTGFIPDNMSSFSRNTKRVIDMMIAFCSLLVFSPLFIFCFIAVKLEDGGPAIYKQERIGRFGRPFNIYKFRSMRMDAEKMGPQLYTAGVDPRLTKIGKFLREHHLDELPQLWNVFIGDMAFIGPRPERMYYIDLIMEKDNRYPYLYQIRPGVTSYATLYNGYTDTVDKMVSRLKYDLYYLQHRSLLLDFKVLWITFYRIVSGKKF